MGCLIHCTGSQILEKYQLTDRAKKEIVIVCALFNCGCRGTTEFREEFEAFLCECHHNWAIKKRLNDLNF